MSNYKYIPTYAGQPIAESKSYLDSLEKQYDLAKDKKNALDVFLGGFDSNDEDGKEYIEKVKGILSDKVQDFAKDSKGNVKWHQTMEGLDSVASQVAGDMKLKHVQERYNKYKEEEDTVRKYRLEHGNNTFYNNDVSNKAFDEEGNPISYQNRHELKQDHIGAAKALVDQMHDQIESITSPTELPGYIKTGKRQFRKADEMGPMLEKAYDIALNDSPELQQLAEREGEEAVKKLIRDTLGLGEYEYTEENFSSISGKNPSPTDNTTPQGSFITENYAPLTNNSEIEDFGEITIEDLNHTSKPDDLPLMFNDGSAFTYEKDVKKYTERHKEADMYLGMLKSVVGEEEFKDMTADERVRAINKNIKNFKFKAQTASASSTLLRPSNLPKSLIAGFEDTADTEIAMNKRGGIYVVGESGGGKDQRMLSEKIGNQIDTTGAITKTFKGIYFGNSNSDVSFDGGLMYTLTDANNRSVDVVVPQPDINNKVKEHGEYRREKSNLVKSKEAFSPNGAKGKTKDYIVNYFSDEDIKSLVDNKVISLNEVKIVNSLELTPYARWDSKDNDFKSGSIISKSKLPAGTTPQQLENLLQTLNIPYNVDNDKIVIDDKFMDAQVNNTALSSRSILNAFKKK